MRIESGLPIMDPEAAAQRVIVELRALPVPRLDGEEAARPVSRELADLVERALQRDPERRFATPSAMAEALGKLEGERLAFARGAEHGVPVVVIQPAIVYGPNAGNAFEMVSELLTSRVVLVNGGTGICNLVYVDDTVTALLLAATHDRAPGERFLISGPEYPTWAQFVGAFEQMLGIRRTVSLSEHEALLLWRQSHRRTWLVPEGLRAIQSDPRLRGRLLATREAVAARWIAARVVPRTIKDALRAASHAKESSVVDAELPIGAVRPWVVRDMARQARVSTEKARRILGYTPVFTLRSGMQLTEQWARWAGLIP